MPDRFEIETDDHGVPCIVDETGRVVRRVIGRADQRDELAHAIVTEMNGR